MHTRRTDCFSGTHKNSTVIAQTQGSNTLVQFQTTRGKYRISFLLQSLVLPLHRSLRLGTGLARHDMVWSDRPVANAEFARTQRYANPNTLYSQ